MMARIPHNFYAPIFRGFLLVLVFVVSACSEHPETEKPETVLPATEPKVELQMVREMPIDTMHRLHEYFDSMANHGRFSGVILTQHDHQFFQAKYGFRNHDAQDTFNLNDQFQLASLTKPVTAFGLLLLVDRGLVELDKEVNEYLFDFPFEGVTVRSLLSHTSGIGNYIYITDSLWGNPEAFMNNMEMYELIRCDYLPRYYPPLKRFAYCNTNYALIPILIEKLTGRLFRDYMQQEVFEPLGMFATEYLDPCEKAPDEYPVLGHYPNGDPKRPFYLDGVIGDKSLYSSVYDLYKFYLELKHPSLLKPSVLQEAMKPQAETGYDRYYGLGWRIAEDSQGDTLIFHNGWWRGFRSYFWMSKEEEKVAIILTNSIRGGYLDQDAIWKMF